MISLSVVCRSVAALGLAFVLAGCMPSSDASLDEQKDPHYLNGRAKVTGLDYKGAMEEFEQALETNPRSASAHIELALLCEQAGDYAAAIYHYEQHLKLRPNSEYGERAREHIKSCKMDLVRSEVIGPVNQAMQKDLERLMTENMLLKQRVETLEAQLTGRIPVASAGAQVSANRAIVPVQPAPAQSAVQPMPAAVTPSVASAKPVSADPPAPRVRRTHVVRSGDKLTSIARDNGVELSKLLKANPGVDPTRLKIGQTINIP